MKNICIFGDSIVCGEGDEIKGGFVNRLKEFFIDFEIYNFGIDGGIINDTQEIFENCIKEKNADTIIFEAGGNDSAYDKDTGELLIPESQFEEIIRDIIIRVQKLAKNIIFVGFPNCDEKRTLPVSWCNLCYENKNIEKYNKIIENVCDEYGVLFIDVFGILEKDDFYDGLHPNATGHEKIFNLVKNELNAKF